MKNLFPQERKLISVCSRMCIRRFSQTAWGHLGQPGGGIYTLLRRVSGGSAPAEEHKKTKKKRKKERNTDGEKKNRRRKKKKRLTHSFFYLQSASTEIKEKSRRGFGKNGRTAGLRYKTKQHTHIYTHREHIGYPPSKKWRETPSNRTTNQRFLRRRKAYRGGLCYPLVHTLTPPKKRRRRRKKQKGFLCWRIRRFSHLFYFLFFFPKNFFALHPLLPSGEPFLFFFYSSCSGLPTGSTPPLFFSFFLFSLYIVPSSLHLTQPVFFFFPCSSLHVLLAQQRPCYLLLPHLVLDLFPNTFDSLCIADLDLSLCVFVFLFFCTAFG